MPKRSPAPHRSGKRPPQPRSAVDHRHRQCRNPDASRSCSGPGTCGLGRHGQSAPDGWPDSAGRLPSARPSVRLPSTADHNKSGHGRTGGTALPVRDKRRTQTSGQSGASALRHRPKRVLDAVQNGCNTARLTRRFGIDVWGATTGQLATVDNRRRARFALARRLSGQDRASSTTATTGSAVLHRPS